MMIDYSQSHSLCQPWGKPLLRVSCPETQYMVINFVCLFLYSSVSVVIEIFLSSDEELEPNNFRRNYCSNYTKFCLWIKWLKWDKEARKDSCIFWYRAYTTKSPPVMEHLEKHKSALTYGKYKTRYCPKITTRIYII